MPFTPFHFGPHTCVALPFHRKLDFPIFLLSNVAVDIEPLLVMVFNLNYPLHGYCHTFLVGALVGVFLALLAFPFRDVIGIIMKFFRLPYKTTAYRMIISGVLARVYQKISVFSSNYSVVKHSHAGLPLTSSP